MDVRTPRLPRSFCALHTHAMPAARSSRRFRKQRHRFLPIRAVTELDARHIDLPQDEHPPLALRIAVQGHLIHAAARRPRFRRSLRDPAAFIASRPHGQQPQRVRRVGIVLRMKLVEDPEPVPQRWVGLWQSPRRTAERLLRRCPRRWHQSERTTCRADRFHTRHSHDTPLAALASWRFRRELLG